MWFSDSEIINLIPTTAQAPIVSPRVIYFREALIDEECLLVAVTKRIPIVATRQKIPKTKDQ